MARGKLRAIGSSIRLKQKFGSGYQISLSHDKQKIDALNDFMKAEFGVTAPADIRGAYVTYTLPKSLESKLHDSLSVLEQNKEKFGLSDVQIHMTSLEEVFLNIAKKAEIEAAKGEGEASEEVRLEDGSILEVPLGQDIAIQEETGERYSIKWAQDEEGKLQVQSWTKIED
jgi:hypothetical protein